MWKFFLAHTENLHSCNNHISVQSGLKANMMELSASEPLGSKPDKYLDPFKNTFLGFGSEQQSDFCSAFTPL